MKQINEIASLLASLGDVAAELKNTQNELLAYARELETKAQTLAIADATLESAATVQITQLQVTNDSLRKQTDALARRNREIGLLARMNDFLQTCGSETEAYSIISETANQLFPDDSGAVFVFGASRNMLEAAVVWGPLAPAQLIFPPDECWALRRGQMHIAIHHELWCPHVADNGHMYVCLPLLAQGETLGILHLLDGPIKGDKAHEERMLEKCTLAQVLADSIGLGIANLRSRETMRNQSIRDPLTSLFNRRYMDESLIQEQYRIKRNGEKLALIMIDIDHFKRFNDNYGHDAGDAVLRELGTFFKKHVRGSDIACRFGGEEFILVLTPSTTDGARQRAEKIRQEAMLLSVRHNHVDLGPITLSLGIAMIPDHATSTAAIIKAADVALYEAKRKGRNQVVMFAGLPETLDRHAGE